MLISIFTIVTFCYQTGVHAGPGKPPTRKRFFAAAFIFISGPYGLYTSTKKITTTSFEKKSTFMQFFFNNFFAIPKFNSKVLDDYFVLAANTF